MLLPNNYTDSNHMNICKQKLLFVSLLIFCILILATGCENNTNRPTQELEGHTWELISIDGVELDNQLSPEHRPSITFDLNNFTVTGSSGCNLYNGTFTLDGKSTIQFSSLISTKKACPEMGLENQFLDRLTNASSFKIKNQTFKLSAQESISMTFEY